jgi:hypothetical protein
MAESLDMGRLNNLMTRLEDLREYL